MTVIRWIRRFQLEGHMNRRPRPLGLTKCTTEEQDQAIVNSALENPFTTTSKLISTVENLDCSRTTVTRRLNDAGLYCRRPATKVDLTDEHATSRLNFAIQHLYRDWDNVVFCDEKTFRTNEKQQIYVYRRINTRYSTENVAKLKNSGRVSTAYWGYMTSHGTGDLVLINNRLTGAGYVEILDNHILPLVAANDGQPVEILQDNSSIHTAAIVQEGLRNTPRLLGFHCPLSRPI